MIGKDWAESRGEILRNIDSKNGGIFWNQFSQNRNLIQLLFLSSDSFDKISKNFKILVMRANFARDFGIDLAAKLRPRVRPYWRQILKWNFLQNIKPIVAEFWFFVKILVDESQFWILGLRISNFEISSILSNFGKFSSNL